jgi:hypothetical protein
MRKLIHAAADVKSRRTACKNAGSETWHDSFRNRFTRNRLQNEKKNCTARAQSAPLLDHARASYAADDHIFNRPLGPLSNTLGTGDGCHCVPIRRFHLVVKAPDA